MTSVQVVETSVNVTTNSPSQDYTHPDDHNLPTYERILLIAIEHFFSRFNENGPVTLIFVFFITNLRAENSRRNKYQELNLLFPQWSACCIDSVLAKNSQLFVSITDFVYDP